MSEPKNAALRPISDDFVFSSVISHQNPRTRTGGWGAAALLLLGAALILAGCTAETAPATHVERKVQVQRVAYGNDGGTREFVGVVRARYETDLGFRVGGKITQRIVNVGDRVQVGDVIAKLDPKDLALQVESAEAELVAATSNLTQAAADLERYTALKARGFAAIADFDRKKSANDEAEGRKARALRSLDLARNQLAYADLRADADGVITSTMAEPGQVVAVGQAVARLAHKGEKEALVALPESWLAEVRGSKATVKLWADKERSFSAKLRELSPQADPATRTYAARFTIPDADDTVAFGMTATVELERDGGARVARLPLSAVLNRGHGPAVYVVDDKGSLALQPVTVASFTEDAALVTGGINDGDTVVTLGVQKLEAGLKVRPVEPRQ